jgi:hypothetical protein
LLWRDVGTGSFQESVAEAIAIDATGHAYVTGATTADNFPTTPGVIQPDAGERLCFNEVCTDAFVTKLNPTGSALVYSTYLFGEAQEEGIGIAVDQAGNAFVGGSTVSTYFPIVAAFQPQAPSYQNGFLVKLNADASRLLYSSYLGAPAGPDSSEGPSAISAVAIDSAGNAYVAGSTSATDFPTTAGAIQRTAGGCDDTIYGCGDAFVAKIAASGPGFAPPTTVRMNSARATAGATIEAVWAGVAAPNANDSIGLYQLGRSDVLWEVFGGWNTTGTAGGRMSIALPAELKSGWYELRLRSGDPSQFRVLARSEPFQVGGILDAPGGGGGSGGNGGGGGVSSVPPAGGGGSAGVFIIVVLLLALAFRRPTIATVKRLGRR